MLNRLGYVVKRIVNKIFNITYHYISLMPTEIRRVINFFRVKITRRNTPINVGNLFAHIQGLPYTEHGRLLQVGEENFLSITVDSLTNPIKFHFGIVRTGALPLIEESGSPPRPFELAENAGFYEPMHAVLFEHGIVGAEYNHFGPRLPRISEYLTSKFPERVDEVDVTPLMKRGIEDELARMGEVKMFKIKLNKDIVSHARDLDPNVFDALNALILVNDQVNDVEVILRAKPRHSFRWDSLKRSIPGWLGRAEVHGGVELFQARALDTDIGGTRTFDFLQNYIRTDKRVVQLRPRSKCVNSGSMYSKIIEAHSELRPSINRILNVG